MRQRLNLVTLGVADLARSRAFYERLGWTASSAGGEGVCFFDLNGVVLALFARPELAKDAGLADLPPAGAVALAQNLPDRDAVDEAMREAIAAGGEPRRAAEATFWGGYSGYVADPDGHLWEFAHNPFWPLDDDGRVRLPA
ncbi:VOC family protein [Alsobacter sp. SYSU M60028]|uniref:VOC family protein n=1 Tax=Alsobacter ponti TaxID=2962936 RepID=A0ABT1LED5_9HYPH|nr:VOC family protein [Alsobacter ponti]MCP8939263.1 VOC family protein [Alsobacter ponti]